MRWLVATAFLAGGCDSLFNLDHLKAPLTDGGGEIDAPKQSVDGALADGAKGTIDAPPDGSDTAGECAISYAGKRYQAKNYLYSWAMADNYCRTLQVPNSAKYSHLAVVDDAADLSLIASEAGSTASWVGLTYDSTNLRWNWVTAQTVVNIVWAPNEPGNAGSCALATAAGLVADSCAQARPFVCECDSYPPI